MTGAVDKPGYYEIIGPRKLLEILAMAGGPQDKGPSARAGDTVNITRQKGSPQNMIIDLKRLEVQMDPELNVTINNGDVVHVPFAGNAYVLGGVKSPGCIPVRDNLTLSSGPGRGRGHRPHSGFQPGRYYAA